MPDKKETVRICVRRSGEKRNAVRGEKQKFPGNLPGTAVLGPEIIHVSNLQWNTGKKV